MQTRSMRPDARSYSAGRFALDLDGAIAGYVRSVSGGNIQSQVTNHSLATDNLVKKQISTVSHEPITVEVGMGMSRKFYEWIERSFQKDFVAYSGEIISADFNYDAQSARVFHDAHIAEVTIPTLDGSSKEPAYMTVKIDPERIRHEQRRGFRLQGKVGSASKKWLSSAWTFELGWLPCAHVARIDSFTWKQAVIKNEVGAFREATKHPARVEVPNLKLSISMADVEPWHRWHENFLINGNCAEEFELDGAISFLGPEHDHSRPLAEIHLDHVGIISLQQAKQEANKEEMARFEVELYVESMRFQYQQGATDM